MYPGVYLAKGRQIPASHQTLPQWCNLSDWCSHLGFVNRKDSNAGIKLFVIQKGLEFTATQTLEMYCNP